MRKRKLLFAIVPVMTLLCITGCKVSPTIPADIKPVISGPGKMEDVYQGSIVTLPTVTANDEIDGDITNKIVFTVSDSNSDPVSVVSNQFVASVLGQYKVEFKVTNSRSLSDSKIYTFECKEFKYEIEPVTITGKYVNENATLPKPVVHDVPSYTSTISVKVIDPNSVTTVVTDYKYIPTIEGIYTVEYHAEDTLGHHDDYSTTFEAKDEFIIGWDKRMHTAGISGLTTEIINNYVTYVKSKLSTDYENVNFTTQAFDQSVSETLINEIKDSDCDMLIGFTNSTIGVGEDKVHDIAHTAGRIAETVGNRFISQYVDSVLAKDFYEASISADGFSSLKVKELKIAWYDNGKVPQSMRDAADLAIEAFLADSGYDIEVTSIAYEKGTGVSYDDVHNAIVNDECAFGINWGSNFNLDSGFKFKNARLHSGLKIGGTTGRYTIGFVKTNGNNYKFYDDIFDFLFSDTMIAIYQN